MQTDEQLELTIARSIGRTTNVENYIERAKDVIRSIRENDMSIPQPSKIDSSSNKCYCANKSPDG